MAKFAEKGTRRSIEDLYDAIFAIREALQDAMQLASEAVNIADSFGGEISRVITAQLNQYFIPILAKYLDDENTPGAIAPLVAFLDSVPLAMTRQPAEPQQTAPAPIKTELAIPPSPAPAEGSYAAKTQQTQESKKSAAKKLTENQYTVVRRLDKMDDDIVFTGTKEEAERKADWLNKALTNSEIDDLDVKYIVKPLELKAQKDVSKPTGLPKVKESSDSDDDEFPDWYEEDDGEYSLPDECLYCKSPSEEFEEIEGDWMCPNCEAIFN